VRWVSPPRPKLPVSRSGVDVTIGLSAPSASSSVTLKEHNGDAPSSPGGPGRSALSIFEYFEKVRVFLPSTVERESLMLNAINDCT
jgi:hypothetical protein